MEHIEHLQAPQHVQDSAASRECWNHLKLAKNTGKVSTDDEQTLDFSKNDPFDAVKQSARVERLKSVQSNYHRDIAAHIKNGVPLIQPPTDPPYTYGPGWLTMPWRPTEVKTVNDVNILAVMSMAKYAEQTAKAHDIPNNLRDPYRHALLSGYETKKYGSALGSFFGDFREWCEESGTRVTALTRSPEKTVKELAENQVDYHNNRVGRRLGSWAAHHDLSEKQMEDILAERVKRTGTDRKIPLD